MRISDWSSDVCSSDLEITLRFAELLNPDGTVDQSNLRLAECTDRFVLAGDSKAEVFEPHFTYHGFRYVEIEGYPGEPTADDIEGIVVSSECRTTGDMRFASPLLQKLWHNADWNTRSTFFSVPTDFQQSDERRGWK